MPSKRGGGLGPNGRELTRLEEVIISLYGRGARTGEVAGLVAAHLVPNVKPERQMKAARGKLRQMEQTQWFRDALYHRAVVKLDLDTPAVLRGVTGAAKRGRVDAAKLHLGIAGRYEEKGGDVATNVQVVFGTPIPRPQNRDQLTPAIDVEAEEVEDEDAA